MNYRTLKVETKTGIGLIWLNRPKAGNALTRAMVAELAKAIGAQNEDPHVRAIVLAGQGGSFCEGLEASWVKDLAAGGVKKRREDLDSLAGLLRTIAEGKKPTVARVQGPALDIGAAMVAACDMAVAAYEAEFCFSEVRLGLVPAVGGPYLVRAVGQRTAGRYLLSGEHFTAAEAYRLGLLTDIAPLPELDSAVNELLGQVVQGGPQAQVLTKEWLLRQGACGRWDEAAAELVARLFPSREVKEGLSWLERKAQPSWVKEIASQIEKANPSPPRRRKG